MSGLEALGIAASIIQVADLGTKLSVKLFSLYRRVKNANDTVQLLSNEIALVSAILRELGDNLKEKESSKLCSDEAFRTLALVLTQCQDVLGQIQRVVDNNEQAGKGRFQQVTGKFRIVLLEPNLDQLKVTLERLKSTMLLLLNVIMYAGQIRSNNIPTIVQEQRDLLENLLEERQARNQKSRQGHTAMESSQGLSTETTHSRPAHGSADKTYNHKHDPRTHRSILRNQSSRDSVGSTDNSEGQIGAHIATEGNTSTELREYNILIQSMLDEVESCKSKLEKDRHSRIRDGVLNIHSGEITRFQIEHGPSIYIDHSLFAVQKSNNSLKPKFTSPSPAPASSYHSSQSTKRFMEDFNSDESDLSETYLAIGGRKGRNSFNHPQEAKGTSPMSVQQSLSKYHSLKLGKRRSFERIRPEMTIFDEQVQGNKPRPIRRSAYDDSDGEEGVRSSSWYVASGVSRESSPFQRDHELVMDQHIIERNDSRHDIEIWKQQQEIERLERKLEQERISQKEKERYQNSSTGPCISDQNHSPRHHSRDSSRPYRPPGSQRLLEDQNISSIDSKDNARQTVTIGPPAQEDANATIPPKGILQPQRESFPEGPNPLSEGDPPFEQAHKKDLLPDQWWTKIDRRLVSPAALRAGHELFEERTDAIVVLRVLSKEEIQAYAAKTLELSGCSSAYTTSNSSDNERAPGNESPERLPIFDIAPQESAMSGRRDDDDYKQNYFEDFLLPGNVEELLTQWTTLNKQEIQRGQFSAD
ncbi:hypothetical protein N7499_008743 [Penicillium canescens]|nr:hypothetical protein N7499_008743 [Penicillium canescens]KAJ6159072.1 hypothetical protein N7485_011898 [Penicillium canescens]